MFLARTRIIGALVIAGLLVAGCAFNTIVKSPPGITTSLILLRHAERPMFRKNLTAEGRANAAALPAALKGIHIDAIYSPDKVRNLDTVAPLAKQRGLTVKVIKASDVAARLIRENPGKTVLWVGNSDNLAYIYEDIGAEGRAPTNYGELFFVRISDKGLPQVTKTHYGSHRR